MLHSRKIEPHRDTGEKNVVHLGVLGEPYPFLQATATATDDKGERCKRGVTMSIQNTHFRSHLFFFSEVSRRNKQLTVFGPLFSGGSGFNVTPWSHACCLLDDILSMHGAINVGAKSQVGDLELL